MSATPAGVQAKIAAAAAELKQTTVGYINNKWKTPPAGTHWANALTDLQAASDEAGQLLAPSVPPPPPPPSSSDYATMAAALAAPTFNYVRHIICATPAQVVAAITNIQPGDWIDVQGVTFPGEIVWNPQLSAYAKITLDAGCRFTGYQGATQTNVPALYLPHPRFLQIIFAPGAYVTNPMGDQGILAHGGDHLVVDGFHVKGCGGDGFSLFPASDGADVQYCFLRGEVEGFCMTTLFDPHAEKGSGIHGMNLGDSAAHVFHHNTVAVYVHDAWTDPATGKQIGGGSCVEIGSNAPATSPHDNVLYVKGHGLLWNAQTQTGGNGINHWAAGGTSTAHDNDFKIIEVDDMAGYGFHLNGTFQTLPAAAVGIGRASQCCLNPLYAGQSPWMKGPEVKYVDVVPA